MQQREVDIAACVGREVGGETEFGLVLAAAVEVGEGTHGGDEDGEVGDGDEEGDEVYHGGRVAGIWCWVVFCCSLGILVIVDVARVQEPIFVICSR